MSQDALYLGLLMNARKMRKGDLTMPPIPPPSTETPPSYIDKKGGGGLIEAVSSVLMDHLKQVEQDPIIQQHAGTYAMFLSHVLANAREEFLQTHQRKND
jgi:hypothetical protein